GGGLGAPDARAVRDARADGVPHRVLHVPRGLRRVLRPRPGGGAPARGPAPDDDSPVGAGRADRDRRRQARHRRPRGAPRDGMARHRYWIDDVYAGWYRGGLLAFSTLVGWIDRYVVDGLLNVCSALTLRGGNLARRMQSGKAQDYVYGLTFGLLVLIIWSQL